MKENEEMVRQMKKNNKSKHSIQSNKDKRMHELEEIIVNLEKQVTQLKEVIVTLCSRVIEDEDDRQNIGMELDKIVILTRKKISEINENDRKNDDSYDSKEKQVT